MTEYRRTDAGVEIPERERRAVAGRLEIRSDGDGPLVLEGYATIYDYRYDVGGEPPHGFTEVIARGAAAKSVGEADVRLLVNHDGVPLARTKSGTLSLTSDDIGLHVRAELDPLNPSVVEMRSALWRGDLDEMSLAFKAVRQEWNADYTERTIREVKLYDVSVVTYPANPATVALMRDDAPLLPPRGAFPLSLAQAQAEALRVI